MVFTMDGSYPKSHAIVISTPGLYVVRFKPPILPFDTFGKLQTSKTTGTNIYHSTRKVFISLMDGYATVNHNHL